MPVAVPPRRPPPQRSAGVAALVVPSRASPPAGCRWCTLRALSRRTAGTFTYGFDTCQVDPACVPADFMLHNRVLLPLPGGGQVDGTADCTSAHATRPGAFTRASAELGELVRATAARAAQRGCDAATVSKKELHLSGFFSMAASVTLTLTQTPTLTPTLKRRSFISPASFRWPPR